MASISLHRKPRPWDNTLIFLCCLHHEAQCTIRETGQVTSKGHFPSLQTSKLHRRQVNELKFAPFCKILPCRSKIPFRRLKGKSGLDPKCGKNTVFVSFELKIQVSGTAARFGMKRFVVSEWQKSILLNIHDDCSGGDERSKEKNKSYFVLFSITSPV